jgi:translation initiation factor 5B
MHEEWPEDDVKPKKGKKDKKKGKKAAAIDEDEDMNGDQEEQDATGIEEAPLKADLDEEWPEEIKPKKGKKGKKEAVEDDDEDWYVGTKEEAPVPAPKEEKEETPAEPAAEAEEGAAEDGGAKVSCDSDMIGIADVCRS